MSESNNRSNQLDAIDRQQREQEQMHPAEESNAFSKPIIEAMQPRDGKPVPPLLTQEELDEGQPRVNWTAVLCTIIVAVAAVVVLLVAKPWQRTDEVATATDLEEQVDTHADHDAAVEDNAQALREAQAAEEAQREAEARAAAEAQAAAAEQAKQNEAPVTVTKDETQRLTDEQATKVKSTLPIEAVTTTGTQNSYNGVRLVNISKRLLTSDEVAQMSARELSLARNAAYARHGYQFNNAELKEFFNAQSWFKAKTTDMNTIVLTDTEVSNIKLIKELENKNK